MARRIPMKAQNLPVVFSMGRSRAASLGSSLDFSTPFSFAQIDDFGLRPKLLHEPKRPRTFAETRDFTARIVQISKGERPGGAGLDTGREVVSFLELAALGSRLVSGPLEPVMAESALLHHSFGANGDVRAEPRLHGLRPLGRFPVELAHGVRTGGGAIPAADAARIDLRHETLVVDLRGLDGTHLGARRVVAVHAG
jgi:hypothetical protein